MSIRRILSGGVLAAALVALTPLTAVAQGCDRNAKVPTADAAVKLLETFVDAGCLGGPSCTSAICKTTNPVLQAEAPTATTVADALRGVLKEAEALKGIGPAGERLYSRMWISLAQFVDNRRSAAAGWTLEEDLALFKD